MGKEAPIVCHLYYGSRDPLCGHMGSDCHEDPRALHQLVEAWDEVSCPHCLALRKPDGVIDWERRPALIHRRKVARRLKQVEDLMQAAEVQIRALEQGLGGLRQEWHALFAELGPDVASKESAGE